MLNINSLETKDSNKKRSFTKYLLYAVGEILIVAIGIIVAIRLENSNEQRQWNRDYEETLDRLQQEIKLNIERLENLDTGDLGIIPLDSVLKINRGFPMYYAGPYFDSIRMKLHQGLDTADIIFMLKGPQARWNHFNMHSEIFEEMIATGMLYKIKPDTLLRRIQQYYSYIEREEQYNVRSVGEIGDALDDIKKGWGMLRLDYYRDGIDCLDSHPWIFDINSDEYNDLRYSYTIISAAINESYGRMKNIINSSQKLLEIIESVRSQ